LGENRTRFSNTARASQSCDAGTAAATCTITKILALYEFITFAFVHFNANFINATSTKLIASVFFTTRVISLIRAAGILAYFLLFDLTSAINTTSACWVAGVIATRGVLTLKCTSNS
jgi:hypothetical protein